MQPIPQSLLKMGLRIVLLAIAAISAAQHLSEPFRIWSVGPLTKSERVTGGFVATANGGTVLTGPHIDSQTGSIFAATRSVVFAGDLLVLASRIGMRQLPDTRTPAGVYQLLCLDAQTGQIKGTREITAFGSVKLFATSDAHVIVAGRNVLRLTPDLKDAGLFDYHAEGRKFGSVESISPDGSTLGNATSPGYELIDDQSLKATVLTAAPAYATSVNTKGFVTDNVRWTGKYPHDIGFVTYTDATGDHLLYHGGCGGRPQFLTDDLVLEPGCKNPLIIDTRGNLVTTLPVTGKFSYAGVSLNGKRFALQLTGSGRHESFLIFSLEGWKQITSVKPEQDGEEQSWTAFSPDGSMFVVGSPLKLTLYRLP